MQTVERIFKARSIAVIGASSEPHKLGFMALNTIIRGGYEGQIYPVNPKGGEILGLKVCPSLTDVPGRPDLAVIVVPAEFVPDVLREAAEKGIPGAVILSAGFREIGRRDLEEKMIAISKRYGIRLIGPNIQGINYLPNKLCAMFFPVITTRGPLGIISQSGSVTAALSEWAAGEGLGISAAINLGNQVDLCESDYLDFLALDEHTKAIALYIEGVKEGRRFLETLKRVAAKKPICILKSGRTVGGQRSASSHTGSLAGNHDIFGAACRQCGVASANDLETLYDIGKAMATMREPNGNRVLSISTSGGASILTADEAEISGLVVPALPPELIQKLKRLELLPLATFSNPLDLASISATHFQAVILLADQFDVADVFLLNFADPVVGASDVVKHLAPNLRASLAVSYMGGGEEEKKGRVMMQESGIPVFSTPERAIRGISAVVRASGKHKTDHIKYASGSVADNKKTDAVEGKDHVFVLEPEAIGYLEQYNIPYPDHGLACNAKEAVEIADRLGYPVVLKVISSGVPHKSDVGGVALGLESANQVKQEFRRVLDNIESALPTASIEGLLVCKHAPEGLDLIVGALEDPVFGATIMFGLGGIFTEVLGDVTFRIAPLGPKDAEEMVREIKAYQMLIGARGKSGYDVDRLIELLLSVSDMVVSRPEIKELDLNPVRLFEKDLMVLDVRLIAEAS